MPTLDILDPADRRIVRFDTGRPPLPGAVAVASPSPDPAGVSALLARLAREAPWIPLAVCTSRAARTGLEARLSAPSQSSGLVPAFIVPATGTHPLIAEILHAVANRPPPSVLDLATWLARRIGRSDLFPILHLAMNPTRRSRDPAEDRSLRRLLAREGLPTPLCLTRLALLARVNRLGRPLGAVAADLGLATRQVRAWLARLAGCEADRWLALPGWEWVLEEAVRRHGHPGSGDATGSREEGVGAAHVLRVPGLRRREIPLQERHA